MKNYPKTTLLSVYLPLQSTKGVFIGEKGTKGAVRSHASNLGARLHKIAVKTRQLPRFRGKAWEAFAAPPAAFSGCPPVVCTYWFTDLGPWF